MTIAAPKRAASSVIARSILRTGRWCRALRMGKRGAEVHNQQPVRALGMSHCSERAGREGSETIETESTLGKTTRFC